METIECSRCGPEKPTLAKPPFRTELGKRIQEKICSGCWTEWLQHQTLLINHYGLDPRDKKAREFLYGQIETVLLGQRNGFSRFHHADLRSVGPHNANLPDANVIVDASAGLPPPSSFETGTTQSWF